MKTKGFTLVEMILSISLVGILFALSAIILDRGLDSYASISERVAKNQDVRFAMERMARELLLVEAGPGGDLTGIDADEIRFRDRLGNSTNFSLSGNTLYRGSDPLLENVTSFVVTGYNSNNAVTTAHPQVRRVRVQLSSLPQGETAVITLRTDIFMRTDMYENFK